MGCKTCTVSCENQYLIKCENCDDETKNACIILTEKERQIWCENLFPKNDRYQTLQASEKSSFHPCFNQIKKDIPRSFPTHPFFTRNQNLLRFEQLLQKFALFFPKIGYTQGLNFVAGYILICGFDDETAFKILINLALHQNCMLLGLYENSFPLNYLYCKLFWKLFEKRLPKTMTKIEKSKIPNQGWIFQWFMTFFLYSFPVDFVKRLIDYIICKKQFAIVLLTLGIINCFKLDIQKIINPDQFDFFELFDCLKNINFCHEKIDVDKVIHYANSFTNRQIKEALKNIEADNNIYYVYFMSDNVQHRSKIYKSILKRLEKQRSAFNLNPYSPDYERDQSAVEHLERFLLKKSQLYYFTREEKLCNSINTSNYILNLQQNSYISQLQRGISENFEDHRRVTKNGEETHSEKESNNGSISRVICRKFK